MEEQNFLYTEQSVNRDEVGAVSGTPAPDEALEEAVQQLHAEALAVSQALGAGT